MKQLKLIIAAALVFSPFAASADPISVSESGALTANGGTISIDFTDLDASDGTGGTLTIMSEDGSTFDLFSYAEEYFDLIVDGDSLGTYSCSENVGVNMGCTGGNLSVFTLVLDPVNLASMISDGVLNVVLDFGAGVDINLWGYENNNTVVATLDYNSLLDNGSRVACNPEFDECGNDTVSVPEPGTLALLGLGLVGMGMNRRRKTV